MKEVALSHKESRHFPSRLLPKGKNDVNIISCVGFPFKQYRIKKERNVQT